MELDGIFARADAVIERLAAARAASRHAEEGRTARVSDALASGFGLEAAKAEREAASVEAAFLSAMPPSLGEIVGILDAAKPFYLFAAAPAETAPRPSPGLIRRLLGSKPGAAETNDEATAALSPQAAQAAYAGRDLRLAEAFGFLDDAIASIPGRRASLETLVFSLQERAVALAGKGGGDVGRRGVYAAEEAASALAGHADFLALQARVLASVDRTPCGIEDDIAEAAEAHMDRALEDEGS